MATDESSEDTVPYKLAVVARSDLRMSAGKLAVQVGHAVHDAVAACSKQRLEDWEADGSMIVVLQAEGQQAMTALVSDAKKKKVAAYPQVDEGLTELSSGTMTAVAFGPAESEVVNTVTGRLDLYKSSAEAEVATLRKQLEEAQARIATLEAAASAGAAASSPSPSAPLKAGEVVFACDLADNLDSSPAWTKVPEMFEMWTWEGDRTILPHKWTQAIEEGCGGEEALSSTPAALKPWEAPNFDEEGIFFLTHRSDTCGVAVALDRGDSVGLIAGLGVHPDYRRRGLGRCLLRLCMRRHAELGRRRVVCIVDEGRCPGVAKLLRDEGFRIV
eukprot:TRINITY_DN83324_c0_g1_i1.p1 TRINITY_DN83324_c0_g1~~TRINITY_DN83324_c0_g1_i1.p1  ORF type:complete len:330 (+),score=87.32 TRINITY_DN83324_c0_g1_i1:78-1067(+)